MRWRVGGFITAVLLGMGPVSAQPAPGLAESLNTIRSVKREGAGNSAATAAWKNVVQAGLPALMPTLKAFQGADATALNWLRTAVDAIAEKAVAQKQALPVSELIEFTLSTDQEPSARRKAYELVLGVDEKKALSLLKSFLTDRNLELRRDAIEQSFTEEKAKEKPDNQVYSRLFAAARDKDQVELIAKELGKSGTAPDITKHYGYITQWHVVGPFPSKDGAGFAATYPPETALDIQQAYKGSKGEVTWKATQSNATYGTVDLNQVIGKYMDSAAYAMATITTKDATPAEIRATTKNAIKIFLNGKEVFAREEYHHGMSMDQHTVKVNLKPGQNVIVLKICQNNQTDSWAQEWNFAARICDATGGALPLKQSWPQDGKLLSIDLGNLGKPSKKEEKK
jgi:hypothetical protein